MLIVRTKMAMGAALAAVALAVVAVPGRLHPANAQPARTSRIEMSRVRLDLDLDGLRFTTGLVLSNESKKTRTVKLELNRLGHDLDGNPLFLPLEAVRGQVTVGPSRLTMRPGGQYSVTLSGRLRAKQGLYLALSALPAPARQPDPAGALATSFAYIRPPKPWRQDVEVGEVSIYPPPTDEPGILTFYAVVENKGSVHVDPTGEIEIVAEGEVVGVATLTTQTVLPGFGRRLGGTWDPPDDLSGELELRAKISNPSATGTGTIEVEGGRVTAAETLPAEGVAAKDVLKWAALALVALVMGLIFMVLSGRRRPASDSLEW